MACHLGISLDTLPVLGHFSLGNGRTPRFVVRRDRSGCDGYDLWLPQGDASAAWQEWVRDEAILPVGLRALDWLRTEAGIPWYGVDMDERNLPMEMGLEAALSARKGCYRGQEIVARVLHRGHLDRCLSGLIVHFEKPPDPGAEVRSADVKIGTVTSAVSSPRLGKPLALAIVKTGVLQSGMPIQVIYGREAYHAEIVRLPLV